MEQANADAAKDSARLLVSWAMLNVVLAMGLASAQPVMELVKCLGDK
jgi:hypothetical protein